MMEDDQSETMPKVTTCDKVKTEPVSNENKAPPPEPEPDYSCS